MRGQGACATMMHLGVLDVPSGTFVARRRERSSERTYWPNSNLLERMIRRIGGLKAI